jgi:hypothetical protein
MLISDDLASAQTHRERHGHDGLTSIGHPATGTATGVAQRMATDSAGSGLRIPARPPGDVFP